MIGRLKLALVAVSRHSERDIAGGRCVRSQLKFVILQDGGSVCTTPTPGGLRCALGPSKRID